MEGRLKLFASLIDTGSFTRAALALRISQPALSTAIRKLERELGGPLLERGDFTLTDAGRLAYEAGKKLHVSEHNLQTELAELAGRKPLLRIGMIDSLAEIIFVHGEAYDQLAKLATLALTIDNSSRLVERLHAGDIDVAFVVADETYPADIVVNQKLGDEPLMLVAAPTQQDVVDRASRTGILENFLSYNEGSRTQRLVQRAAAQGGLALDTRFYATSPSIMLGMALQGKGIAALPAHMLMNPIGRGELLAITVNGQPIIERPLLALTRRGRRLPDAAVVATRVASSALSTIMMHARQSV